MGRISFAAFRPKAGHEADFLDVVRDHLPVLRSQGLATDRAPIVCRAQDGTVIEVFEWVSDEAIERAHSNPEVLSLWRRYEATSDYVPLAGLEEIGQLFSTFDPVEP